MVVFFVVVVIGSIACQYIKKKANQSPGVVRELTNIPPPINMAPDFHFEADELRVERFLRKIAKEKPVRFTSWDLNGFTSNYSTRLGSGGFGKVFKGKLPNGMNIAVKVLKRISDKSGEKQFMAEVGSIYKTHHINLVRLYGFCYEHSMSALVFEYMENGSLDKYLFGKKNKLEWEKLHNIAIGTARGLAYLHEDCQHTIIHYDIKPANILLDANFFPKVGDFGLAKLYNRDCTHFSITGYRGTPGYSAPEMILTNYPITHKCDVYSFGMVLFEIIGRKGNAGTTVSGNPDWFPQHVRDAHEKGKLVELIVACGIGEDDREKAIRACNVALWCAQDSPDTRPPMSAVVKMLEGGVEIMPPPMPFQYLNSIAMGIGTSGSQQTNSSGSSYSTNTETNSQWYKQTTPMMTHCEIETASSRFDARKTCIIS